MLSTRWNLENNDKISFEIFENFIRNDLKEATVKLYGIDIGAVEDGWDTVNYIAFQIFAEYKDGEKVYYSKKYLFVVSENPDDGYRSSMDYILVNPFNFLIAEEYLADITIKKLEENDHEIIEIYDKGNNKLILRFGTEDWNDYYPCFIREWIPENLYINEGK